MDLKAGDPEVSSERSRPAKPVSLRRSARVQPVGAEIVGPSLLVASAVFALLTLIGVLLTLAHLVGRPEAVQLTPIEIFGLMAGFVCGLTLALLLLVLSIVLSYARSSHTALKRLTAEQTDGPAAQSVSAKPARTIDDEMLVLLRELRDNSLLSDAQKKAKLGRQATEQRRALTDGVRSFLAKGEFHRALSLVDEMERRFESDSEIERIRTEIRASRERAERADIDDARRKIDELIAISAWPRAEELAVELLDRHPDAAEARHLANRVVRQHRRFDDEQRLIAYAEVQRHTSRKQWKKAVESARTFIERFPKSIEAEALRVQIETLAANAEIEDRQEVEGQFKALLKQQRFAEALDLARDIIRRYPNSPQAEALENQLPRLEAKAQRAEMTNSQ